MRRVAVVTGANRGLGFAISEALATLGLHVVLTGRDERAVVDAANKLLAAGLDVSAHQLDITDPASVARAIADIGFEHGKMDVLVNNAAVAIDRARPAHSADMEIVAATMNANLLGAWRCCIAAIPQMRQGGYGRIVNVTSHMSLLSTMKTGSAAYRISKTALNALTCVLADEVAGDNILVNAASPGLIATRLAYGKAEHAPAEVVDTFTWLATLPDDGPRGQLFHERRPLPW
ncbi:short-chain dehydrogenase [Catellatospora sp. TT07R-123]|uniref:SDR family NAD(P)-dependent oxidoreductase n=1 Tax=Catellatospora sp. TT07R-123 TaxID=2733863 RepID=UPI001B0A6A39|nr:SDR family NAD(P)-dependent oxidoreductase [Catellatospora sp. TT07R-123]GHJ45910.1 short-chain dehydrogenase [Catellatospora sp. TT07R-123]